MVKKWNICIPELTGKKKRRAYVYFPVMYKSQPRRRFPVLYMFDGHNVFFDEDATFGKSWGLAQYLDATQTPLIVAAVECNNAPGNARLSEYSPYDFSDDFVGAVKGQGATTMHWFIHSFKLMIDKRFRTIPWREFTFIGGSSMGGLMSLYAVARFNYIFSRAAALSPHIWAGKEQLLDLLRTAPMAHDTVIYMDWGSAEVNRSMSRDQRDVSATLFDRKVSVTARVVPDGEHSEASWEKQAPFFIQTLMYGVNA